MQEIELKRIGPVLGNMRFFRISVPVVVAFNRHTLAFSRAA